MNVLGKIMPLIFLILFGYILQRLRYFEEVSFNRLQNFILKVAIPCLLFTAFVNMQVDKSHLLVSAGIFLLLLLLLGVGYVLYRLLHIKHDFFMFFLTTFGFGTVGFPLFSNIFGLANADYMALIGVGHEFFAAGVYFPILQFYFSGARPELRSILKALASPSMIMVALGMLICLSGLKPVLMSNFIGEGLLGAISKLGDVTLALTLVLVGYRLRLQDKSDLKISAVYSAIRLAVTLAVGIAFKELLLDVLVPPAALLDHAFYTLILQHSSIMLLVFVGQYRPMKDQIIINNSFVLNMAAGIILFFLYMLFFV